MRFTILVLAVIVAAVVVSAATGSPGSRVRVTLEERSLRPDAQSVAAGRVTFETVNRGTQEHELLVVRTDLPAGDLPMGLEGPALELAGDVVLGAPHSHHALDRRSAARHVAPGGTRRETVELSPGRYVLLCSLPGHYAAGQRASLLVR